MTRMTEDELGKRARIANELKAAAPNLQQATLAVLTDMYSSDKLQGTESDKPIPLDGITSISLEQGAMINGLMRTHCSARSLEIGFAYGFSTIWMLDALQSRNNSGHLSIDPFEKSQYGGIGLCQVQRLAPGTRFNWKKQFSIHALSDLIREAARFDFVFIDGNHRFDDVIVDFYLCDQILAPGGLIAFDDMWMPSVRTAVSFVLSNRDYELVRQPVRNMTVIKKRRDDTRDWTHFNRFRVGGRLPSSLARLKTLIAPRRRD